jgi:hypothetical protein
VPFRFLVGGLGFATVLVRRGSHRRTGGGAPAQAEARAVTNCDAERIDAALRRDQ